MIFMLKIKFFYCPFLGVWKTDLWHILSIFNWVLILLDRVMKTNIRVSSFLASKHSKPLTYY
jgi:hypothetical protein